MHNLPRKTVALFPKKSLAMALITANLLLQGASNFAYADQSTSTQQALKQHYSIPAGTLGGVLSQFASQADVTLSFDASLTDGKHSNGLDGSYSAAAGFELLLKNTGLQFHKVSASQYQIIPSDSKTASIVLSEQTIVANQLGTITENSGSYTPGTIATATRLVLTPRETPQSISVITRQKMDDFALNSIDDVVRHTPGVSVVTYDSERTEYYARGFAIQNFQYDGIPMSRNSAYSAGNTLSDMAIYDRVEVLKGATGLLTGTGTPGATLNLIRKKPTHDFQGHVSLGAGSWDTYRTEIDLAGPLSTEGNVRGRIVTAQQAQHSWQDRYKKDIHVFYGILEADLNENTLLTVGADYQDNKPKGSTWGGNPYWDARGNVNETSRSFSNAAEWSRWEQYTRTVFSTLEHSFKNGWTGKIQLNHQINGYDSTLAALSGGNPDPKTGLGAGLWSGKYVGKTTSDAVDMYVSGFGELLGREHEFVVGTSYSKKHWENEGQSAYGYYASHAFDYYNWKGDIEKPIWENRYTDDEKTYEQGYYLTGRFNLADDLKLILGGRLSNFKDEYIKETDVMVPFVGITYDLNKYLSAYASYSEIFKPQDVKDINNRSLEPMTGTNYELGLKGEALNGRINLQAAYFELKQDNYAEEYTVDNPVQPWAYRAVKGVVTKGYELEVSGALTDNWQLQAGISHATPKRKGQSINTIMPKTQFNLYSSYRFQGDLAALTLGAGARWQSKTWHDSKAPTGQSNSNGQAIKQDKRFTQSDFWLVDAMANYQVTDNVSVSLNVNNLLDEKYYTMMSHYSVYSWGAPRSYMLSTRFDF